MEKTALENQKEYLIGDVAEIVGLSRDALRFYEKKGVITAKKKENGYRCYTGSDIYRLMYIQYHRRMNTSLKDIEDLMRKDRKSALQFKMERIEEGIKREEEAIRDHERAITRLKLLKKDSEQLEKYLNRYCLKSFPASYVIDDRKNLLDGMLHWFRLSRTVPGFDMTYLYTEMQIEKETLKPQRTSLLLYRELEKELGVDLKLSGLLRTRKLECIYTTAESKEPLPDYQTIEAMLRWGKSQGLRPQNKAYVNNLTSFYKKETPTYGLEIYLPIEK